MLKLSDHLKANELLAVPYRGKVVDNADPKRLGRIKVQVEGLLEASAEDLPWVYQKSGSMLGGRTDLSSFAVPEINSEVVVEFPYNDIYAGFYSGYWQSETTHQGFLDEDYPHSYGFRDIQNTFLKISKAKKILEFQHASGARVFFDADSTIEVKSSKAVIFRSIDDKTEFKFDMVTGDLVLKPKNELEIGGNTTKYTAKQVIHEVGTVDENIKGYKKTECVGGYKTTVGGSLSQSVVGNVGVSVGGDVSDLTTGETEKVYGQKVEKTVVLGDYFLELLLGNREISILAGNHLIDIVAGNIEHKTAAGSLDFKNLIGKVSVSALGDLEMSNLIAKLTISNAGAIELSNALAKLTMDVAGAIELSNPLASIKGSVAGGIDIEATLNANIKAMVNATVEATVAAMLKGLTTTVEGTTLLALNGAIVQVNSGVGPVVTSVTSPFIDLITGAPQIGVPTFLA